MRSSVVVPFRLVTAMDYMVGSSLPATSTPNGGRKGGDQSLDVTKGLGSRLKLNESVVGQGVAEKSPPLGKQ